VLRRFQHNMVHTYPNRLQLPISRYPKSLALLEHAAYAFKEVFLRLMLPPTPERSEYWKLAFQLLSKGDVEVFLSICITIYGLSAFAKEGSRGVPNDESYFSEPQTRTSSLRRLLRTVGAAPTRDL
jgi:hypothetical protein